MVDKADLDYRFLGDSPLFLGLEDSEIARLVELARIHTFGDGDAIVEEGSKGDSLFLLYSGSIAISTRDKAGSKISLATLVDRGAFLGEMSLVDPGPRSATVKAVGGEALMLELTLEALEEFFEECSEARVVILRNIARVLARRLRDTNVRVAATSS